MNNSIKELHLSERAILLVLGLSIHQVDNLGEDGVRVLISKVRKSIARSLSNDKRGVLHVPEHGGYTITRTRETIYMTKETFIENKGIISKLLQGVLNSIPKQKNYRYYWDKLRKEWNQTEGAKIYGALPKKNHDNAKTQFSINSIYDLFIRKDDIEEFFGIKFPETIGKSERIKQKLDEKIRKEDEKNVQEKERFNKLSWEEKMREKKYIGSKSEFQRIIAYLYPIFQKEMDRASPEDRRNDWRNIMNRAFKEFNTQFPENQLALLHGNYYGKYGRDIWRSIYKIGKWTDIEEKLINVTESEGGKDDKETTSSKPTAQSITLPSVIGNQEPTLIKTTENSRKVLIQSIKGFLIKDIYDTIELYAKTKSLSWQIGEFSGFPSIEDGFRIQIDGEIFTIYLPEIKDRVQKEIWSILSHKDYIQLIEKQGQKESVWKYIQKDRRYKITYGKYTIFLNLPQISQASKIVTNTIQARTAGIVNDSLELMNGAKAYFIESINTYLEWYFSEKIKNPGIKKENFILEKIQAPIRWILRNNNLTGSFTRRYELPDSQIMEALHKKQAWDEFIKLHPDIALVITAISGESENIRIHNKDNGVNITFVPYYKESKEVTQNDSWIPDDE